MTTQSENFLNGKWDILRIDAKQHGQEWVLYHEFAPGEYAWEFTEERILSLAQGETVLEGKLKEVFDGEKDVMEYAYYPRDGKLYTDRTYRSEFGHCGIKSEQYRVERISLSELWLYDLANINAEDQIFRVYLTSAL